VCPTNGRVDDEAADVVRGVESFGIITGNHTDVMPAHYIRKLIDQIGEHGCPAFEQRTVQLDVRETAED
jgi:hypothetical protein